ncbi:rab gdp/gtp exchange factor [Anaeramoeba flamelloides]|uniref:Rab gdp/gtp exchange factor n=1 Tax=Anaeramoeba flamelloides TaxID=1746091 RepID=A0AAV7YTC9_9EUKA|nr:rab gdp/gtp exchange factor [Anaeramoeba flamelloides]
MTQIQSSELISHLEKEQFKTFLTFLTQNQSKLFFPDPNNSKIPTDQTLTSFLESHSSIINPQNPTQFLTFNFHLGVIDEVSSKVLIVAKLEQQKKKEISSNFISKIFTENQNLFAKKTKKKYQSSTILKEQIVETSNKEKLNLIYLSKPLYIKKIKNEKEGSNKKKGTNNQKIEEEKSNSNDKENKYDTKPNHEEKKNQFNENNKSTKEINKNENENKNKQKNKQNNNSKENSNNNEESNKKKKKNEDLNLNHEKDSLKKEKEIKNGNKNENEEEQKESKEKEEKKEKEEFKEKEEKKENEKENEKQENKQEILKEPKEPKEQKEENESKINEKDGLKNEKEKVKEEEEEKENEKKEEGKEEPKEESKEEKKQIEIENGNKNEKEEEQKESKEKEEKKEKEEEKENQENNKETQKEIPINSKITTKKFADVGWDVIEGFEPYLEIPEVKKLIQKADGVCLTINEMDEVPNSIPENVLEFVDYATEKCPKEKLFPKLEQESDKNEKIEEFFLEYIMLRISGRVFAAIKKQNKKKDKKLKELLSKLNFLNFQDLGIEQNLFKKEIIDKAKLNLKKINNCMTPRQKLTCINDTCIILLQIFEGETVGADDFLPLVIYCLLYSNPKHLQTNLTFIESFSKPNMLNNTNEGYNFSTLLSAQNFLENLNYNDINLDPLNFILKKEGKSSDSSHSLYKADSSESLHEKHLNEFSLKSNKKRKKKYKKIRNKNKDENNQLWEQDNDEFDLDFQFGSIPDEFEKNESRNDQNKPKLIENDDLFSQKISNHGEKIGGNKNNLSLKDQLNMKENGNGSVEKSNNNKNINNLKNEENINVNNINSNEDNINDLKKKKNNGNFSQILKSDSNIKKIFPIF